MAASTRGSTTRNPEPPLRILCLGDSLTSGYPDNTPYAGQLIRKIEAAFPGRKVQCDVDGLAGDFVTTGKFTSRMRKMWESARHPYDWTIVLGGTNDLAVDKPAHQLILALKGVWGIPLSKGGKVLALTIPETKASSLHLTMRRNIVNDAIRNNERENYYYFDLWNKFPYHQMEPANRGRYWRPDGVHFQAAGYDLMGQMIGDGLVRILRLAEAQGTDISSIVTDRRQREAIEDLILEEEVGDSRLLSQGYIVVRKRDLD
ncbi:SGNH hydrolase-type esterase domain-containing protein [Xylaria nigripes]|nr:SGNH hydrolase-type esterase domain-containing protein [Xylaria nigripes]